MKMKSILFFTVILFCSVLYGQEGVKSIDRKLLFGKWISEDDKQYSLSINKDVITEFYGKEKTGVLSYKIFGNLLTQINKKDSSIYNYIIREVDSQKMVWMYLDRGNFLKFTKKK